MKNLRPFFSFPAERNIFAVNRIKTTNKIVSKACGVFLTKVHTVYTSTIISVTREMDNIN